jgi:ribosomal protein L11 methyltransferase
MSDYYEYNFQLAPYEPWNEIITAYLADVGFESFVDEDPILKAYIPSENLILEDIDSIILKLAAEEDLIECKYSYVEIKQQNWNALWESQFEPVYVNDQLLIKAPFHTDLNFNGLIVEIEPKMSFGTGHHQTTFLMCQEMMTMNLKGTCILDMGAGTGVLSILAEKLGADYIEAVEIESWSAENCAENATRNDCSNIVSLFGDFDVVTNREFDVILANINKNVLKSHLAFYASRLKESGQLLLSGFFTTDNEELIYLAEKEGFNFVKSENKENWSMLKFNKY